MKIGLAAAFGDSPYRDIEFLKDFAQAAEACGFNSLWAPEHIVFFSSYDDDYPYNPQGRVPWKTRYGLYDPLMVCAVAACVTTRLRLGTTVLIVPERPALLTAREVMTLDHVAGGRFELGVGLGWSSQEYAALGVPWEGRGQRFDEYLEAVRIAWTSERAEYNGNYVRFKDVILEPAPVTEGGPPILVGGNSGRAIRRAVRIGDGWYGVWPGDGDPAPLLDRLFAELDRSGRRSDNEFSIKLNLPLSGMLDEQDLLDKTRRASALGLHEFVVQLPIRSRSMDEDMRHWSELLGLLE